MHKGSHRYILRLSQLRLGRQRKMHKVEASLLVSFENSSLLHCLFLYTYSFRLLKKMHP